MSMPSQIINCQTQQLATIDITSSTSEAAEAPAVPVFSNPLSIPEEEEVANNQLAPTTPPEFQLSQFEYTKKYA